jgi:5'-nucleotidase
MQQRIGRPVSGRDRFPRCFLLSLLLAALFGQTGYADQVKLKIIAFNDFHGHLQSSESFRAGPQSPDVPAGGIDVLAGYVEYLKAQNPYHVVVSAGDLIGASPLVSALYHDEGTIETMNRLGLEISAVGNHEFDKGRQELLRMQSGGCFTGDKNTCRGAEVGTAVPFGGAKFEYLAANVFDEASGKTIFPAYVIKTYNSVRVAFIGLTLEGTPGIVRPGGIAGLRFAGEASTINALVRQLRAQGIQCFVVLIHQGGWQVTKGTDDINGCEGGLQGTPIEAIVNQLDDAVELVISGHTHQAYICQVANSAGRKIPVTSAASFGRLLTDIDVTVDTTTKKVTGVMAQNIVVDRSNTKITVDAGIKGIVDRYGALAAPIANRVLGSITADITRNTLDASGETALGHLIADAQLEATRDSGAVVAFTNSGGIRGDLLYSSGAAGERKVTYGELFTIQPFQENLVTMTLTGAQLKTLLEEQFKGCALDFPPGISTRRGDAILQVSEGFTYSWNRAGATCNKVDANSIKMNGVTVDPTRKYRVTVSSYLAEGGDRLYEFTHGMERVDGAQDVDSLAAYFAKHHSISPSLLDRIKTSQQPNPD